MSQRHSHAFVVADVHMMLLQLCDLLYMNAEVREGFLADIPVDFRRNARIYDPKPDIAHGQAFFWHESQGSVQGITELTECVRTEEAWLLQIQKEMRVGALSEDSWHFLHGCQTKVPGSSVDDHNTCGNHSCSTTWRQSKIECEICKEDRKSCRRVIDPNADMRVQDPKFLAAPAIFPSNDIKCELNKTRVQLWAADQQQAISWSIAKDKPGNHVLVEKHNIEA